MYKVPQRLVAIIMPNPDADPTEEKQYTETADLLDKVEEFGYEQYGVGKLLCVKYHGRYYISTFYFQSNRRDAEFDAAHNGFPFYADDNDKAMKVGLLARLYRAIIV
jgi:hypothetical protein